jgi:hypothetical protein
VLRTTLEEALMGRILHQGVFEDAAGLRGFPTRENQFVFNKPVESLTKFGVPRLTLFH